MSPIFLDNKYTRWYYQIVNRARGRQLPQDKYREVHHIIPKSMGGEDSESNLVELTAREHFICHWLLTKMTKTRNYKNKMIKAIMIMSCCSNEYQERYKNAITSRVFECLRKKHASLMRKFNLGHHVSASTRAILSEKASLRKHTAETKKLQSTIKFFSHKDEVITQMVHEAVKSAIEKKMTLSERVNKFVEAVQVQDGNLIKQSMELIIKRKQHVTRKHTCRS
jgi:HNH endonuclease